MELPIQISLHDGLYFFSPDGSWYYLAKDAYGGHEENLEIISKLELKEIATHTASVTAGDQVFSLGQGKSLVITQKKELYVLAYVGGDDYEIIGRLVPSETKTHQP